jgi:hypothetical protein
MKQTIGKQIKGVGGGIKLKHMGNSRVLAIKKKALSGCNRWLLWEIKTNKQ